MRRRSVLGETSRQQEARRRLIQRVPSASAAGPRSSWLSSDQSSRSATIGLLLERWHPATYTSVGQRASFLKWPRDHPLGAHPWFLWPLIKAKRPFMVAVTAGRICHGRGARHIREAVERRAQPG